PGRPTRPPQPPTPGTPCAPGPSATGTSGLDAEVLRLADVGRRRDRAAADLGQLVPGVSEAGQVVGGQLELVGHGQRVKWARLHAQAAVHAPGRVQVVYVQNLLAGLVVPVRLDLDAVDRARLRAQLAGDALQVALFVAEQDGDTTVAQGNVQLFLRVVDGDDRPEHLADGDSHADQGRAYHGEEVPQASEHQFTPLFARGSRPRILSTPQHHVQPRPAQVDQGEGDQHVPAQVHQVVHPDAGQRPADPHGHEDKEVRLDQEPNDGREDWASGAAKEERGRQG